MKKLSNVLVCLTCFCCMNILQAQDKSSTENSLAEVKTLSSNALVCTLSGPELIQRKTELQEEVFSQVQKVEEVEKGYTFHFAYKEDFLLKLTDYMLAENKCCPFFQFDLSIQANHAGLALTASGPPEVKSMLKGMLNELSQK